MNSDKKETNTKTRTVHGGVSNAKDRSAVHDFYEATFTKKLENSTG